MDIAILGMGIIGGVWARNLQADGLKVKTWNRTKMDFPGWRDTPAEAISGAGLIIVVVADPPAVRNVLDAILPSLKPGQIVMQSSTISSQWTLAFAEEVQAKGAIYLEAPFTGSKPAAEQRKTVFYLGGEAQVIDQVRPVLSRQATHLLHVGALGSASALKLSMNMNIAMVLGALSESRRFALAQGLSDEVFFEALRINISRSGVSDLKEPKLRTGDFSPQFSLKHMNKDLKLAEQDAAGMALPMFRSLQGLYDNGMAKGLGDLDFAVLDTLG